MKEFLTTIRLDVNAAGSRAEINVKQENTGKLLEICLNESGRPYFVDDDCRAVIAGTRNDGFTFFNDAAIKDGVVVYELTELNTSAVGPAAAELRLYGPDGELIASPTFTINVIPSAMGEGQTIESAEATALTQLIREADAAIDEMQASTITGAEVSVGNEVGEPSATVELEQGENGQTIKLAFANLKGDKGEPGEDGQPGPTGLAGANGVSPTIDVSKSGKTTTLTITDATGTKTAEILDGEDGEGGSGGGADLLNENGVIKQEHLPEGYPYSAPSEGFILPETTITDIPENGESRLTASLGLVEGQTYTVTWNGATYECACSMWSQDGMDIGLAIGNLGLATGGTSTGEPFVIVELPLDMAVNIGNPVILQALDGSTSATLSITGITTVTAPIAQELLPVGYPYFIPGGEVILEETTVSVNNVVAPSLNIKNGYSYAVAFNGETYECTVTTITEQDITTVVLGNQNITSNGIDTGEPFLLAFVPNNGWVIYIADGISTGTLSIVQADSYIKIDERYLPLERLGLPLVNSRTNGSMRGTDAAEETDDYQMGKGCFAFGFDTKADNWGCVAFGKNSSASGAYSFACGSGTYAAVQNSTAMGVYTTTNNDGQLVVGRYNDTSNEDDLFVIGNGNADKRSNCCTISSTGYAWFKGEVFVGCYKDGVNLDGGSKRLATEKYVDNAVSSALILSSPGGKRFKVTVDDSGTLTTTEVTE